MENELTSENMSKEEKLRRGIIHLGMDYIKGDCCLKCGKKLEYGDKMYYDWDKGYICEECAWKE